LRIIEVKNAQVLIIDERLENRMKDRKMEGAFGSLWKKNGWIVLIWFVKI
jgi:hypothetical protein